MNGYYVQSPFGPGDNRRASDQSPTNGMMGMMPGAGAHLGSQMLGPRSLDDIVNQNSKDYRRRSVPVPGYPVIEGMGPPIRRQSSMMDFAANSPSMDSFSYDPTAQSAVDPTMQDIQPQMDASGRIKRSRAQDLSVSTQFQPPMFSTMRSQSSYGSPLAGNSSLDMDPSSPYITSGIPMGMDMNILGSDMAAMEMFGNHNFDSSMIGSPMQPSFGGSLLAPSQDPGGGGGGGGGVASNKVDQKMPRSSEHSSATPDYRQPISRTSSNDNNSPHASSRTTNNSVGLGKPPQRMLSDSQTPVSTSYSSQTPVSTSYSSQVQTSSNGTEMIGGQILPWTTPSGKSCKCGLLATEC